MGAGFENPKMIRLQDDKLKSFEENKVLYLTYINWHVLYVKLVM